MVRDGLNMDVLMVLAWMLDGAGHTIDVLMVLIDIKWMV